jgi:hypothetical protein
MADSPVRSLVLASVFIAVIVASPLLSGVLADSRIYSGPPLQTSTETTIFYDDFESYSVNTFPSQGGWEITWGGTNNLLQNHMITDSKAYAGSKSLQLTGLLLRRFNTTASIIGYEFAFLGFIEGARFTATSIPTSTKEKYALIAIDSSIQGSNANALALTDDQYLSIGSFQPQQWQVVRVVLDRGSNTYSVWINGILKASSLPTHGNETSKIDSLELWGGEGPSGGPTCFDNVRVFAGSSTPLTATTIAISTRATKPTVVTTPVTATEPTVASTTSASKSTTETIPTTATTSTNTTTSTTTFRVDPVTVGAVVVIAALISGAVIALRRSKSKDSKKDASQPPAESEEPKETEETKEAEAKEEETKEAKKTKETV